MMFVLGIGSVVALHSSIVSVICDQFTSLRFWVVGGVASLLSFGVGLMYITPVSYDCMPCQCKVFININWSNKGWPMDAESSGLFRRNSARFCIGLV